MKKTALIALVGYLVIFLPQAGQACVGARPISMGGAFIGVADDANVTYWNPGGLGFLVQPEATYTYTYFDREGYNYLDYASLVVPLAGSNDSLGSLGMAYINTTSFYSEGYYSKQLDKYTLSYGAKVKALPSLSIGLNAHYLSYYYETIDDFSLNRHEDESWNFDFGALLKVNEKISLGFLGQDYIGIGPDDPNVKYGYNTRFGLRYSPDPSSTIAFDTYGDSGVRLGGEKIVYTNPILGSGPNSAVAFRAGCDKRFEGEGDDLHFSFGVGFIGYNLGRSTRISLDYTLLYWPLTSLDIKTDILVGFSIK